MKNGWDNKKEQKHLIFIMDSNNNNDDNITQALNNRSESGICLLVQTETVYLMFESV